MIGGYIGTILSIYSPTLPQGRVRLPSESCTEHSVKEILVARVSFLEIVGQADNLKI